MDVGTLASLFKQTLDPSTRESAEAQLNQAKLLIGFSPALLQVVMAGTVDAAVRQAGVIYFKRMISSSWEPKDDHEVTVNGGINGHSSMAIHEQVSLKSPLAHLRQCSSGSATNNPPFPKMP